MKIHTALIRWATKALNRYLSARVYWYHSPYNSLDPENFVTYTHKYTALQIKAIWYSKAKETSFECNQLRDKRNIFQKYPIQWRYNAMNNNNNNDSSNGSYTENPYYCQICGNSDILYETQFDCTRKSLMLSLILLRRPVNFLAQIHQIALPYNQNQIFNNVFKIHSKYFPHLMFF